MEITKRIRAAEIDGRASNGRYIQKQLSSLHDILIKNVSKLQEAMMSDSHNHAAEAEVEFHLAVDCVKKHYDSIDFEKELKDEYAIASGENTPERRIAAGIVYIIPAAHTLLYSVISPLSAAIAAGNCTIIELESSILKLPVLLRSLLTQALDHDTVAVLTSRPKDASFLEGCVRVHSQGSDSSLPSSSNLMSIPKSRVIAVVDRSADIDTAVERIVRARAGFGGKSPYAPDVVLVNEFRMKEFTSAAVSNFTKYLSASVAANGSTYGSHKPRRGDGDEPLSKEERAEPGTTVVLTGDNGTIVTVTQRRSELLTKKVSQPLLVIHAISSLDDAIDLANSSPTTLLAVYAFASLSTCKYLVQFICAHVSFSNDIPVELLLGPTAPLAHPACAHPRYSCNMFTVVCPAFAHPASGSDTLRKTLDAATPMEARELRKETILPLKETGQGEGKVVGFFDQGMIVGALIYVVPLVMSLGVLGVLGVREGIRRLR